MTRHPGLTVQHEGPLAIITFDEVQLKIELLIRLALCIGQLESDERVKAIILVGRRNVFMSGADLREFDMLTTGDMARKFMEMPLAVMRQIYGCSKVLIAAINGYCIGGGLELALACDFRICVDRVLNVDGQPVPFLGLPEVGLGVVSPLGSSYFLPRVVGLANAKEIMLTADPLDARTAGRMGLVHAVVPDRQLLPEARRWAERVIKNSMSSVRSAKHLLNRSFDQADLTEALRAEQDAFAECCETPEKAERVGAKVHRRQRLLSSASAAAPEGQTP